MRKTLLLHYSAKNLPSAIKPIYLNCEDFKKHSFPNVLIEILDSLFNELEKHLTGWFGRKKLSRNLIADIRKQLDKMRKKEDKQERDVRQLAASEIKDEQKAEIGVGLSGANFALADNFCECEKREVEQRYKVSEDKIRELDTWLPKLKQQIRDL